MKLSLLVGKSLDVVFYLIVPILDIDFVLLVFVEIEVLSVYGVLLEFLCGVCGLSESFAFNVLLRMVLKLFGLQFVKEGLELVEYLFVLFLLFFEEDISC